MREIDLNHYLDLCSSGVVLERDTLGFKVIALPDGRIVKIFRRKRWLSSAAWFPYAARFAANCERLRQLGFDVPRVLEVGRVASISRDVVVYRAVPGISVRKGLLSEGSGQDEAGFLLTSLIDFIDRLFSAGVLFRSLHLGNVVLMPDGRLALIDVADMRFYKKPLSPQDRRKSIKRMLDLSTPAERAWLEPQMNRLFLSH